MNKPVHIIILNFRVMLALIVVLFLSCNSKGGKNIPVKDYTQQYYQEQYRPQFHFSPESGWMNDPNGLVFLDGEYHLFYQYYPDSTVWGPMHWGHAVSNDLVHWTHLPVALYPDSLGFIFSGSAIVDALNTTGFGTDDNPAVVAIFTYHNQKLAGSGSDSFQSQGIAYSTDKGRTFTKYSGNPVLPNQGERDFRDPKVFWHEITCKWIMILAVHDRIQLFSSPDLKSWSFESEFGEQTGAHGGVWECPDLFPLKITGSEEEKWVMLVSINPGGPNGGSATQYFTGDFDGHKFVPEKKNEKWLDWGTDNYAGVTWSGIPEKDGRRLFIGWMSNWNYATDVPASSWRSALTIPRELTLKKNKDQYLLVSTPVIELTGLRKNSLNLIPGNSEKVNRIEIAQGSYKLNCSEIIIDFEIPSGFSDSLGIILANDAGEEFIIGHSVTNKQLYIDRTRSGKSGFSRSFNGIVRANYEAGETLKLHIFIDASSAEVFVDDGLLVMTSILFPEEEYSRLRIFSRGEEVLLKKAELYELNSIWR
jgi:fructan beta-fructosidase